MRINNQSFPIIGSTSQIPTTIYNSSNNLAKSSTETLPQYTLAPSINYFQLAIINNEDDIRQILATPVPQGEEKLIKQHINPFNNKSINAFMQKFGAFIKSNFNELATVLAYAYASPPNIFSQNLRVMIGNYSVESYIHKQDTEDDIKIICQIIYSPLLPLLSHTVYHALFDIAKLIKNHNYILNDKNILEVLGKYASLNLNKEYKTYSQLIVQSRENLYNNLILECISIPEIINNPMGQHLLINFMEYIDNPNSDNIGVSKETQILHNSIQKLNEEDNTYLFIESLKTILAIKCSELSDNIKNGFIDRLLADSKMYEKAAIQAAIIIYNSFDKQLINNPRIVAIHAQAPRQKIKTSAIGRFSNFIKILTQKNQVANIMPQISYINLEHNFTRLLTNAKSEFIATGKGIIDNPVFTDILQQDNDLSKFIENIASMKPINYSFNNLGKIFPFLVELEINKNLVNDKSTIIKNLLKLGNLVIQKTPIESNIQEHILINLFNNPYESIKKILISEFIVELLINAVNTNNPYFLAHIIQTCINENITINKILNNNSLTEYTQTNEFINISDNFAQILSFNMQLLSIALDTITNEINFNAENKTAINNLLNIPHKYIINYEVVTLIYILEKFLPMTTNITNINNLIELLSMLSKVKYNWDNAPGTVIRSMNYTFPQLSDINMGVLHMLANDEISLNVKNKLYQTLQGRSWDNYTDDRVNNPPITKFKQAINELTLQKVYDFSSLDISSLSLNTLELDELMEEVE